MYNEGQLRDRSKTLLGNGETYDTLATKVGVSRSTVNVFARGGKVSEGTLAKFDAYLNRSVREVQQKELQDIGYAMKMLIRNKKVKRSTWVNKYLIATEVLVDANFEVKPVIFIVSGGKSGIAWSPNTYELFATNWEVID